MTANATAETANGTAEQKDAMEMLRDGTADVGVGMEMLNDATEM